MIAMAAAPMNMRRIRNTRMMLNIRKPPGISLKCSAIANTMVKVVGITVVATAAGVVES